MIKIMVVETVKRNKNTTPKKIVVIKDTNKDANSTTASPTPTVTHQRV